MTAPELDDRHVLAAANADAPTSSGRSPAGDRLPTTVIHYSRHDPRYVTGGVERFARTLELIFERVEYLTPGDRRDRRAALDRRVPIICDNQRVLDWPEDHPVIGFQHGVGAVKFQATRSFSHWLLARAQARAARRTRTLWVACAQWVAAAFKRLHGTEVNHVVYYTTDCGRFDGRLENRGSRLVLHDARTPHKGRALIPLLQEALPAWTFEPLGCPPEAVPDRMRRARAFIHLSRYEGNSLVCNEAMAMNLPCLFTRVGLMTDLEAPTDVSLMDVSEAYGVPAHLIARVGTFLRTLDERTFNPRAWVLAHSSPDVGLAAWSRVLAAFEEMSGWNLEWRPRRPPAPDPISFGPPSD